MNDQSTSGLGKGFDIPDPADLPSLKGTVSETEWALRAARLDRSGVHPHICPTP